MDPVLLFVEINFIVFGLQFLDDKQVKATLPLSDSFLVNIVYVICTNKYNTMSLLAIPIGGLDG